MRELLKRCIWRDFSDLGFSQNNIFQELRFHPCRTGSAGQCVIDKEIKTGAAIGTSTILDMVDAFRN